MGKLQCHQPCEPGFAGRSQFQWQQHQCGSVGSGPDHIHSDRYAPDAVRPALPLLMGFEERAAVSRLSPSSVQFTLYRVPVDVTCYVSTIANYKLRNYKFISPRSFPLQRAYLNL